jgi:hypothetical protein
MMNMDLFRKITDEVSAHAAYMNFYFQGEPFLHTEITEMFTYAASKKMYTSTSTNAHYLDARKAREVVQSGLNRLIISIDGTTQEVYESYRIGGTLSKVIEGTRNVIQAKKELRSQFPKIVFQFLVVRPNEHQVREVKKLADELGAGVRLRKRQCAHSTERCVCALPQNRFRQVGTEKQIGEPMLAHVAQLRHYLGRLCGALLFRQRRQIQIGFAPRKNPAHHLEQSGLSGFPFPLTPRPQQHRHLQELFGRNESTRCWRIIRHHLMA